MSASARRGGESADYASEKAKTKLADMSLGVVEDLRAVGFRHSDRASLALQHGEKGSAFFTAQDAAMR